MKFVSSREIRINPEPIFEAAEEGDEIIITSRGKPVALLVGEERARRAVSGWRVVLDTDVVFTEGGGGDG